MPDQPDDPILFETSADLRDGLTDHHEVASELRVRIYKKGSGAYFARTGQSFH